MKIVDAQRKAFKGKAIALQKIGLCSDGIVTDNGLCYALENGVSTIEAEDTPSSFYNTQPLISVGRLSANHPQELALSPQRIQTTLMARCTNNETKTNLLETLCGMI
jgi:hypothetical protein